MGSVSVGYGVLPRHRRRGYATEILRQSMIIARANGVEQVLVTCDDDNLGSIAVIEACGGRLDCVIRPEPQVAGEEGFRESRTGQPPRDQDISWTIHGTSNMSRALGLLAAGGDWPGRSYAPTGTGKATALEALRARATGPRTIPWT